VSGDDPAHPNSLPADEGGKPIGQGLTPEERAAHKRRLALRQEALSDARAAADKWAGATAALFGALGIATIVQGGAQIRALAGNYELADAAGTLLAFTLAVGATVWAMIAAQAGSPVALAALTADELLAREEEEATKVEKRVNQSRRMLVVAVCLIIASMGFLFFAPRDARARSPILAILRSGQLVCGKLQAQTRSGVLHIKTETGLVIRVRSRDALSLSVVAECPSPPTSP
jgi:hypothetical protein